MKNKIIYIIFYIAILYIIIRFIYRHSEKYTPSTYISSYNFIYICDHRIDNPTSESTDVPSTYPKSNGETVYPDIRRINENTASIIFANPPISNQYIVYISI